MSKEDLKTSKKEYYKYLYKYHPDKQSQNNTINISNIFRTVLKLYSQWKENPENPKLSPFNIKPDKLNSFLFDTTKSKKKYYCINDDKKSVIIDNDNNNSFLESIVVKHISQYFLQLFMEKKEITPNFIDNIYQSVNGIPGLINILTDGTNKEAVHNIIIKLLEGKKGALTSNIESPTINQTDMSNTSTHPNNIISPISKVYYDSNGNKIDENVINNVKTEDIIYNVSVSALDIYNNIKKELNVNQKIICTKCNGKGMIETSPFNNSICFRCNGQVTENQSKTFQLDIRKKKTVYPREGHQGLDRNYGDLIINIKPKPMDDYEIINDYDLVTYVELGFIEVYTQFDFYLKYINGAYYHIQFSPRNLSNKDYAKFRKKLQIRVRDKGLPIEDTGRFGDLYIKFKIVLPNVDPTDISKLESISSLQYDRKSLVPVPKSNNIVEPNLLAIELF